MTAYGLAHLRPTAVLAEEVFEYMERIQAPWSRLGHLRISVAEMSSDSVIELVFDHVKGS
jgi:hypothetical protein